MQAKELPWLPGLLFGGLSTAAGLLTLLLPETLNRPLPQTIDDIEQWYSGKHTAEVKSNSTGKNFLAKESLMFGMRYLAR